MSQAYLVFLREGEELLDEFFGLADPLRDEVRRADGEEGRVGLGGAGLGEEGLARAGRAVEEDAFPGLADADEDVGELDGEDDGFFEGLLGLIEARDVFPADVGLLPDDGLRERVLELVVFLVPGAALLDVVAWPAGLAEVSAVALALAVPVARACASVGAVRDELFHLLGFFEVLFDLLLDDVCGRSVVFHVLGERDEQLDAFDELGVACLSLCGGPGLVVLVLAALQFGEGLSLDFLGVDVHRVILQE